MPAVETNVFREFCESGLWTGVGAAFADVLDAAGIRTPSAVTQEALAALPTVTDKRARTLFAAWKSAQPGYAVLALLLPHGLPARWVRRLVDRLGVSAADELSTDPWQLLVLPDVPVEDADRFARLREPDVQADDPRRTRALVARALGVEARSGHTVSPIGLVASELARFGIRGSEQVTAAIDAAQQQSMVRRFDDVGDAKPAQHWVGLETLAQAEDTIARELARLEGGAKRLGTAPAVTQAAAGLDDVQAGAVAHAAAHGVSLLTGGPGTGKSRTVTALVRLCELVGAEVALAAPTGRAAKRLSELIAEAHATSSDGSAEVGEHGGRGGSDGEGGDDESDGHVQAVTIHRLLGARLITDDEDGSSRSIFEHDGDDPIEADLVVIDETSMLDVELAAALLVAIPTGAHVVFVGDPAQLPSIGPGRVLEDLIMAQRYSNTELTTLYRQEAGGAIARLAAAVRGGELVRPETTDREVVIVPAADSSDAARRVAQLVSDSIPRVFGTAAEQIQVMTPVHRGPAGTQALNAELKKILNPGGGVSRRPVRGFDVGDRVVATANHFDAEPNGYANGEIGTVVDADSKSIVVDFPSGPAEITGKALGDLLHGWAITVHRAQGSEWEAVVAVFPPEAGRMLSRPLVYTALTRARRHLSVVHASGPALAHAVRRIGSRPRRTRLTSLITSDPPV